MTLLLVWRGVVRTIREKRSLFRHTRCGDIQLCADYIRGFLRHSAQRRSFATGNRHQAVDVMSLFVVVALEGTGDTAPRTSTHQWASGHVNAARFCRADSRDELTPTLEH